MLVVTDLGLTCAVKFKYHQDYIDRIRKVLGARYNNIIQQWEIPKGSIGQFESIFSGEIYWKDPKWKILGLPKPEYNTTLNKQYPIPSMKLNMFKYQEYGYQFLMNKINDIGFGFNTMDVGLGKTPVAIACFYNMVLEGKVSKCIILAKKSIKKQWCDEFKKFTDIDTIVDYLEYVPEGATKVKRKKMYDAFKKANKGIIVTTYQSSLNDEKELMSLGADMMIIDEAHILRTVGGKMNTAVSNVAKKIKYKLLLTGTPVMSKPKDAYALMNICDKKYFDMSYKDFKERYIVSMWKFNHEEEIGYKNIDELRSKCQNVMIRLTEHEVDIELPEIISSVVKVNKDATQNKLLDFLKGEQLNILDTMKHIKNQIDNNKAQMLDTSKLESDYYKAEASSKGLIACRQAIANDPKLLSMTHSNFIKKLFDGMVPNTYTSSEKTDACIDIVENVINSNGKVIIFSKFERATRMLADAITSKLKTNILLYTGEMNEKDRLQSVELFKNNSDCNVLIGTDAMAEGVNLQEASYLIHYDLPDSVAVKTQREGRIRRASSTHKHGYVYTLVTEGTVDQENLEKLENQDNIFGSVVGLSGEQTDALKRIVN